MHEFWSITGPVYHPLRLLHIAAGSVALFAAPVALSVVKGSKVHRRAGRVFVNAMGVVASSALVLALINPNPFLLLIAVFAFYLAFTGVRMLRLKRPEETERAAQPLDLLISAIMGIAGVSLIGLGLSGIAHGNGFAIVYLVFGGVALFLIGSEVRARRAAGKIRTKWLSQHIIRMLAAYISTVTAFSAVNFGRWLPFLPPVVIWLWPTVIGSGLIAFFLTRYALRGKPGAVSPPVTVSGDSE